MQTLSNMALGPLANMPDLFLNSTGEDANAFETVVHNEGHQPTAHTSGWRTSTLRDYKVTYSYDIILRSPWNQQDEQEINSCDDMVVEVHALDYNPPTRQSGWHTSTVPGHTITYCWDFDPTERWQDPKDDDRNSVGITDSEAESEHNTEENNDFEGTDWVRELQEFNEIGMRATGNPESISKSEVNRQEDRTRSGCAERELKSQDIEEDEESCQSDSTDWEKELGEVEYTEDRMSESSDSNPEVPERRRAIDEIEKEHIHRQLPHLDHARLIRLFEYLEMERPGTMLASVTGSVHLENFSELTLRKIHDLVLESLFEIEEGGRETRYLGTVRNVVEARTATPAAVDRPPLHWRVFARQ